MKNLTDQVYSEIYEDIISGKLAPGSKLPIIHLTQQYKVGMTPVREALSKLVATELVQPFTQRGFQVAPVSKADLHDVYTTRRIVETESICLAMDHRSDEWEAGILAAFYKLSKFEKESSINSVENYSLWEQRHREFYEALNAACPLNTLKQTQQRLYVLTERYRRQWLLASLKTGEQNILSLKQKPIMDAVLEGKQEAVRQLLKDYFSEAENLISLSLGLL